VAAPETANGGTEVINGDDATLSGWVIDSAIAGAETHFGLVCRGAVDKSHVSLIPPFEENAPGHDKVDHEDELSAAHALPELARHVDWGVDWGE
jgi:hypothetical protein